MLAHLRVCVLRSRAWALSWHAPYGFPGTCGLGERPYSTFSEGAAPHPELRMLKASQGAQLAPRLGLGDSWVSRGTGSSAARHEGTVGVGFVGVAWWKGSLAGELLRWKGVLFARLWFEGAV